MSTLEIVLIIVFTVLGITIIGLILSSIKVVSEANFLIIERLGKYSKTWEKGIHIMIPIIDRVVYRENYKEKVFDFPAQTVITKDNTTIKVDTVVYLKIFSPKLFAYGSEKPIKAIENLSATTLRNLLGELELDQSLTSREMVNTKLTTILDNASDAWGIKVIRVEIQNIIPPLEIQDAMAKQMRAEREKRASILESEGNKQSAILVAEGRKESQVLEAEGRKTAVILAAEAKRQSEILEAQGKHEAVKLINNAGLNFAYLQFKAIEELGKLSNGQATKIILPPNLADIAKMMAAGSEIFSEINKK